jgi:hypothetical protein
MNVTDFSDLLLEYIPASLDQAGLREKFSAVVNRMLLQIYSSPALLSNLVDFTVVPVESKSDLPKIKVQLAFNRLPAEVFPRLEELLSLKSFDDYKYYRYIKNGRSLVGLEITISDDNLNKDKYSYAL